MSKLNIGVIFGGNSTEHEVSVITGLQVLANINKEKYQVIPIYVSKQGEWFSDECLSKAETFKDLDRIDRGVKRFAFSPTGPRPKLVKISEGLLGRKEELAVDVFFPCFHGGLGESGGFAGLFEVAGIPYIGSGILGSSLGMDKVLMRQVFTANNIPQTEYTWYYRHEWEQKMEQYIPQIEAVLQYPLFVKPSNSGSSIGVARAENRDELLNAVEVASVFDQKVMVEKAIVNAKEINISVLGNSGGELRTSVCERVVSDSDFLDYDQKYKSQRGKSQGMVSARREIPAILDQGLRARLEETAKKVFNCLNCHGLARVDFLVKEETEEIFVIEINTIPGSMSFYLWEAGGLSFPNMIDELINLALSRFDERRKTTTSFSSNILSNFSPSLKAPKI